MRVVVLLVFFYGVCSKPTSKVSFDTSEQECLPCNTDYCPKIECKFGVTKDKCGCCDTCLRDEGDTCGGIGEAHGICREGLICQIRHPTSQRNLFIDQSMKIGRCEPEVCSNTVCGMHQWCKKVENLPVCYCRDDCESDEEKLCSLNGTKFKNICDLRRRECQLQEKIPHISCKDCYRPTESKLETIESGTILNTSRMCEKEECVNGLFKIFLDDTCLKAEGFSCSESSYLHQGISCSDGYFCNITKFEEHPEYGYPNLGQCNKIEASKCYFEGKQYNFGEKFVNDNCTGYCKCNGLSNIACVSLCPPVFVNCNSDEIRVQVSERASEKCFCERPTCMKKSEICKFAADSGSCYGYFPRWHFDPSTKTCKEFIYGGCQGNKNNFATKDECLKFCGAEDELAEVAKRRRFSYPVRKRQERIMSNKTMTISGLVILPTTVEIPPKSCLVVRFQDVTLADISSRLIATQVVHFNEVLTIDAIDYSINSKMPLPEDINRIYSVSAVLNIGWCSKTGENEKYIEKKDYLSDVRNTVVLNNNKDEYIKDINIKCYDCDEKMVSLNGIQMDSPIGESEVEMVKKDDDELSGDDDTGDYNEKMIVGKVEGPQRRWSQSIGFPEGPKFGNEMMLISGKIIFPDVPKINASSCLRISLKDVTVADSHSITIASVYVNASSIEGKEYEYVLESKKPLDEELNRRFTVFALLNVNWCPTGDSLKWIKKGDYLTDTAFSVELQKNISIYKQDVHLICYDCEVKPNFKEGDNKDRIRGFLALKKKPCLDKKTESVRNHGETWFPDVCTSCVCDDGFSACAIKSCVSNCTTAPIQKPGECCPQCLNTCLHNSKVYNDGDEWSLDSCTRCSCVKGEKICSTVDCLPESMLSCDNPTLVDGECCKTCPTLFSSPEVYKECFDEKLNATYQHGDEWKQDDCVSCKCNDGFSACAAKSCVSNCANPIKIPGECCSQCSTCTYDNKTYQNAEKWSPNPCMHCRCIEGQSLCSIFDCLPDYMLSCENPVKLEGECCKSCPETSDSAFKICTDKNTGKKYSVGESWNQDPCNECKCTHEGTVCQTSECTKLSCDNPVQVAGQCCPVCAPPKECLYEVTNKTYRHGEEWNSPDFCGFCVCDHGTAMCATSMCAIPPCSNGEIITIPGKCCPVCSTSNVCRDPNNGRAYTEDETWQNINCEICKCTSDRTICENPVTNLEDCESSAKLTKNCDAVCLKKKTNEAKCKNFDESFPIGSVIKRDCNTCVCIENDIWACTKMACLPKEDILPTVNIPEDQAGDDDDP